MSVLSDFFKKMPVRIPYSSGFDKSFRNTLTGTVGTLIPVFCDELIPGSHVSVTVPFSLKLPPLATDTFMNVDYKLEAFFIPTRLCMASDSYEKFLIGDTDYEDSNGDMCKIRTPVFRVYDDTSTQSTNYGCEPGSLLDYLGFKSKSPQIPAGETEAFTNISALPMIAYHLLWEHWYRNSMIQKTIFSNQYPDSSSNLYPSNLNRYVPNDSVVYNYVISPVSGNNTFFDGSLIEDLRQRNFGLDYFTSATTRPQNGQSVGVRLRFNYDSNTPSDSLIDSSKYGAFYPDNTNQAIPSSSLPSAVGSIVGGQSPLNNQTATISQHGFTIASLRSANSLQQFLERNRIAGNRLVDYVKANYGADLSDAVAQRPVYIASKSVPVYTKGVYQTAPSSSASTNNPFDSVGAQYGMGYSESADFHFEYKCNEPGYLMIIGSLVPEVTYASGISRMLTRYIQADSRTEMANPLLQNVGPQPIFNRELAYDNDAYVKDVFGYVDRYADWMTRNHELHGLLRDGETLEAFALQRSFSGGQMEINDAFLQIPKDYLDQVMAVTVQNSGFNYWADFFFDYKVAMPLQRYSIPSLQDPAYEHGTTVMLRRGGVRID